jgi:hypothetical protein
MTSGSERFNLVEEDSHTTSASCENTLETNVEFAWIETLIRRCGFERGQERGVEPPSIPPVSGREHVEVDIDSLIPGPMEVFACMLEQCCLANAAWPVYIA